MMASASGIVGNTPLKLVFEFCKAETFWRQRAGRAKYHKNEDTVVQLLGV